MLKHVRSGRTEKYDNVLHVAPHEQYLGLTQFITAMMIVSGIVIISITSTIFSIFNIRVNRVSISSFPLSDRAEHLQVIHCFHCKPETMQEVMILALQGLRKPRTPMPQAYCP